MASKTFTEDFILVSNNINEYDGEEQNAYCTDISASDSFISEYLDQESKYSEIEQKISGTPFCLEAKHGMIWYCLSTNYDERKVSGIVGKMHNCRHCMKRMSKCAGYFGPNGYVIDLGGEKSAGPLYSLIEHERETLKTGCTSSCTSLDPQGTFIVSQDNLNKYPRVLGINPSSGEPFTHIGLNYPANSSCVTKSEIAKEISPSLLNHLWNGSMDGRLYKIVSELQRKDSTTGESKFDTIQRVANSEEVLRKDFWSYRISAVEKILSFANNFKYGNEDWMLMSDVDKMHVRIFALLYFGNYTQDESPVFKAIGQVLDIFDECSDPISIPGFMNERSNPMSYMVQQVASRNAEKNVNAPFTISLAWKSKSDLDGHLVNIDTKEIISYMNKESRDGMTYLNFDANAYNPTEKPVETFTLNSKCPGKYTFFVNNYCTRGNDRIIPFNVISNLNGTIKQHEDSWNCKLRNTNTGNILEKMIEICTIEITQNMIDSLNIEHILSRKQINRLGTLLPKFNSKFGNFNTTLVDMTSLKEHILIEKPFKGNGDLLSSQRDNARNALAKIDKLVQSSKVKINSTGKDTPAICSSSNVKIFKDLLHSIQTDSASLGFFGRDFCPSTITTHSCGDQLKNNTIVNSYMEEGKPPVQPNPEVQDMCRFEKEWSSNFAGVLYGTAVLPVNSLFFKGYFVSLDNVTLPSANDERWCVGGGMYPTDLLSENHEFREIWTTLHTEIRPTVECNNSIPAIGVFLHSGKRYNILVNGSIENVLI